MNIIHGNLLSIEKGIICHQVNCQKVAGAGLALQIKLKWPNWYEAFISRKPMLGSVGFYRINEELTIADLYAQMNFGRDRQLYTIYDAFGQCVSEIRKFADENGQHPYFPYGIGCGLANGNIITIQVILQSYFGPGYTTVMRD